MTKSDLIKHIAEHTGLSKAKAAAALDCIIHCIQDALFLRGRNPSSCC